MSNFQVHEFDDMREATEYLLSWLEPYHSRNIAVVYSRSMEEFAEDYGDTQALTRPILDMLRDLDADDGLVYHDTAEDFWNITNEPKEPGAKQCTVEAGEGVAILASKDYCVAVKKSFWRNFTEDCQRLLSVQAKADDTYDYTQRVSPAVYVIICESVKCSPA